MINKFAFIVAATLVAFLVGCTSEENNIPDSRVNCGQCEKNSIYYLSDTSGCFCTQGFSLEFSIESGFQSRWSNLHESKHRIRGCPR